MAKSSAILRQTMWWTRKAASSSTASPATGPASPPGVPAGHVAVRVGRNRRRFVLRLEDLNHPIIRQLLRHAEEEFGFPSGGSGDDGPIIIPCNEDLFADVLRHIASSKSSSSSSRASLEGFCRLSRSCFSGRVGRRQGEETLPLLRSN